MTTKLTLSMEKAVIERAKQFASKSGRSLSELIESYLETLVNSDSAADKSQMPPKLKSLYGTAKIPLDLDHKKEIRKIQLSREKR